MPEQVKQTSNQKIVVGDEEEPAAVGRVILAG